MKKLYTIAFLLFLSVNIFAQKTADETYEAENAGYFITPIETPYGIIFTDNYASKIYLFKNGKTEVLAETPGCGRYFSVTQDRRYLLYKEIDNNGMQSPVAFDIKNQSKKYIANKSKQCSQPSMTNSYATIYITEGNLHHKYVTEFASNLPKLNKRKNVFSNIAPISPDGKFVVYDNNQEYLLLLNLETGKEKQLPYYGKGVIYPKWSPDSKKILFQNREGELLVYDLVQACFYPLGKGGAGNWDAESENIVYQVTNADAHKFELRSSEIFISHYKGHNANKFRLTNTPGIYEMTPSFDLLGGILYQTYDKRQIIRASLNTQKSAIVSTQIILNNPSKLKPTFYNTKAFTADKAVSITHLTKDVPYIHQKYDAPTGSNGGSACAPTTTNMAFAYYNRLPKWPINANNYTSVTGTGHTNDYAGYAMGKYKYNEHAFDAWSSSKNCWGGYGYMWISPYNSPGGGDGMRNYQNKHDMTSGSYVWLSNATFAKVQAEIDNEYPQPICSWITHSGHLTLAVGYVNGQHTVIFNDPWGNKNTPGYPSYDGTDAYYDWPGYNNGYQNLDPDGSHGKVAWTLTARSSEPVYDDLQIENINYNHGFHINNSEDGAKMSYYRHVKDVAGSSGHIWWTGGTGGAASDVCWVSWTPNLPQNAAYEVEVYIPAAFTDTYSAAAINAAADYKITHSSGTATVTINQDANKGSWVSLGTFQFPQGQVGNIRLGDAVASAENGKKVLFDAVRFTQVASSLIVASTNVTCTGATDGTATVTTSPGPTTHSYLWSPGGEITPSISGLSPGNYSVTVTDGLSTTYSANIEIEEAALVLSLSTSKIEPSIFGASDGQVSVSATSGIEPYTYSWSPNVSSSELAQNLPAGAYTITVTDAYGCSKITSQTITDPVCTSCCELLNEDFTGQILPANWTLNDFGNNGYNWTFTDPGGRFPASLTGVDFDSDFAVFDDDNLGNNGNLSDASLTTPAINCTGRNMVILKFTQRFRSSGNIANAKLQISTDNSTWADLQTYNTVDAGPEIIEFDISAQAANQASVYIRWRYTDGSNWSNYWAIDNVLVYAPPSGTKTISANGGDYQNFTEAITAINNCGIGTGGVSFLVATDEIFIEDPPIITATGTATKPVVFIKNGSGSNPILKPVGTAGSNDAGFTLAGSDYFTFDGIDVVVESGSALEFGYYLFNNSDDNGSQHNTIKNCSVTLNKANTNSVGIKQLIQLGLNPTVISGANSFNIYQNLTIANAYMGINLYGYEAVGQDLLYDDACEVSNCNISNFGGSNLRAGGILAWEQKNINLFENEIYAGATTLRTYGIYLADYSSGNIYKNRVYDIYGTDSQVAGIRTYEADCNIYENEISDIEGIKMSVGIEAFGGTSTIYNNYVSDIKSPSGNSIANGYPSTRGISLRGTNGTQSVFYNTVYLSFTSSNAGNESTCLYIDNASADLRNNIFENNSLATTGTRANVLYFTALSDITGLSANTDNNLYYNGSAISKYALAYQKIGATDYLNLVAYQGISPNDANSIEENPPFKSTVLPYNLHLDPTLASGIDGGGVPVVGITTDFDGEIRNITTPDIGADEYDTGDPLCGTTYTIDNTSATAGLNYNNFTDAINGLNDRGISCAVVFNVQDAQTFVEDVPALEVSGTSINTITFQQSGTGVHPVLKPTGTAADDDFGIYINGGDYFTFNGIDISISSGSATEYGYYISNLSATDGAQHNTIKNCAVTLNRTNINSVGIYQLVKTGSLNPTVASGANSYNIYDNVFVENTYFGIKIYGYDVTGQEPLYDDGTQILNCKVNNFGLTAQANRAVGIHTWSQVNLDIHDNIVTNGTTDLRTLGIYAAGNNSGNIYNNLVHGLYGTDSQVAGLRAYESSVNFYNNEVYDIHGEDMAAGIEIYGGSSTISNNFVSDIRTPGTDTYTFPTARGISNRIATVNIYNNSILLNAVSTAETSESAGIFTEGFSYASATSDIRNNLVVNKTDITNGGLAVALYKSAEYSTISVNSDNNLYFSGTPDAKHLIYYDTNISDQTLAEYQIRTGTYELNSISEDAPFISSTNLHILSSALTEIDGGGQILGSITTDFDAETRDATIPDIGADEYDCDFLVWRGTVDTDWATPLNWRKQQVPTSADNAVIPDVSLESNNFPIITSAGEANDLSIYTGANLQINPDFSLSVNGIMDNKAGNTGLVIKSDATGTGSFINATESVPATVERHLTGTQWHYLASPITDAPITMFNTNNFYSYNETETDSWSGGIFSSANNGWVTPTAPNLETFKGYAYYFTPTTLNFTGNLHTGTYTSPLQAWTDTPEADQYEGWYLVGNPYPSAIDFSAANILATNINLTNLDNSIYFYDDIAHNYKGWNAGSSTGINGGSQYIPPMQGFFIHGNVANSQIQIENAARVHNTVDFLRNPESENSDALFLSLETSANGFTDETKIIEFTGSYFNFDNDLDLYKMYSRDENVPQIWSMNENVEFALNAVPYLTDEQVIPLGFKANNSELYEISLSESNLLSAVYIIDKLNGTFQNLTENPVYSFTHIGGTTFDRFEIRFAEPTGIEKVTASQILIYPNPTKGIITIKTGTLVVDNIQITDISGKVVLETAKKTIDLSGFGAGIYFVKISSKDTILIEKLIID